MAYLGVTPTTSSQSLVKQDFSVSATTGYTLSQSVTSANDIALYINNVRQEPTYAYSASGTSLTLTAATAGTDDMYCIYLGRAVGTVNPASGSVGSSQLASEAVTNAKVASSIITGQTAETSIATDDTVLIHDTSAGALRKMTRANFVSGVGGDNTPIFHANKNDGNQTIANTTATKVTFVNEVFDASSGEIYGANVIGSSIYGTEDLSWSNNGFLYIEQLNALLVFTTSYSLDLHYGANLISFPIPGSVGIGDGIPDDVEDFFTGVDYIEWTDEECEIIRELLKTETQ